MKSKPLILAVSLFALLIIQGTLMEAVAGGAKKKKKTYKYKLVNKTGYTVKINDARIFLSTGSHNFKNCLNKRIPNGKTHTCKYTTKKDFKKAAFEAYVYRSVYPDQHYKTFKTKTGTWKVPTY